MKHHHPIILWLVLLLLAACGPTNKNLPAQATLQPTKTVETSAPAVTEGMRVGITPSPSLTLTRPVLSTATATITPTLFDNASAVQSSTPVADAPCSKPSTGIVPTPDFVFAHPFDGPNIYAKEDEVLDFLNKYGAEGFYSAYQNAGGKNWPGSIQFYGDLTHDGIPELAFGSGFFYIFGCKAGHYVTLFKMGPDAYFQPPKVIKVLDANRNGIPEITLLVGILSQGGHYYQVIEWDGDQFQSVLTPADDGSDDSIFVEATGSLGYGDVDQDGVIEYIANIGIPVWETYRYGIPWRNEKQIYKWNGAQFIFDKSTFSAPEYRFQAVQDGDRAMRYGDFDSALTLYQNAIFDDKLEGWSPERRDFVLAVFNSRINHTPTPVPPLPDPEEYDHLAAYARYRIMLHHLSRGWVSDAKVVYDTLQKKYPEGQPGHIYAALAEKVWTEFSRTKDLGKACGQALEFVSQNSEAIFYYISGSGFPGNHGIDYKANPELMCPDQ